jgi:hypothetical protein
MKIELKSLKIAQHLSEETTAFTATIYVDGMKVGTVKNDGQGGSNSYYLEKGWVDKLEVYAKSLPDLQSAYGPLKMDLDLLVDELMNKQEQEKHLKRQLKKTTFFRIQGEEYGADEWRTVKSPYNAAVQAFLDKKYGDRVIRILNKELN